MPATQALAQFTDREQELARLEQLLSAPPVRVHAALVGLRRSGKTVLLERFAALHRADRIVATVQADDAANGTVVWAHHTIAALVAAAARTEAPVAPDPAAIRTAAAGLDAALRGRAEELLGEAARRRLDNYQLFAAPLRFAQEIAQVTGREVILAIDEFPEVLKFKKLPSLNNLEGTIRAIVERESPQVFYVITGSAVRQMKELLSGDAPLLTRFERISLRPFTPEDAEVLLDRVLGAVGSTIEPYARGELLRWAQGHPFYIDKLTRRAAALAGTRRAREIGPEHLHEAFQLEVIEPEGAIAQACQWIYERSLGPRGDEARSLLGALSAVDNAAKPADLNEILGWDRSKLSRQLQALVEGELVVRSGEGEGGYVALTDPLFAVWLARRTGRVGPLQADTVAGLRKILAQRDDQASSWYEAYTILALANFDGKGWPSDLFGQDGGGEIVIPAFPFEQIEPNPKMWDARGLVHGRPSDVEVDAYALGAEGWLVEMKAQRTRATKGELEELERAARMFREDGGRRIDRLWFVAQAGFHHEALVYGRQRGIYMTRGTQLREIRRQQVERASRRRRAAARAAKAV